MGPPACFKIIIYVYCKQCKVDRRVAQTDDLRIERQCRIVVV